MREEHKQDSFRLFWKVLIIGTMLVNVLQRFHIDSNTERLEAIETPPPQKPEVKDE